MSCAWCGKEFHNGSTVISGGLGQHFCSNKCKEAYEANEREREARERNEAIERKRRYDEETANLGFFGRLFRTIKRIFYTIVLLFIVYVVYSYCKSKGLI